MNTPHPTGSERAPDIDFEEISLIDISKHELSPPILHTPSYLRLVGIVLLSCLAVASIWLAVNVHTVIVHTSPKDATVQLTGGRSIEIFDRFFLFSGNYTASAEHSDYLSLEEDVTVNKSIVKTLNLTPKPGNIFIQSNAPEAKVWIDDEFVGLTNTTISHVNFGSHRIKVEDPFYKPYEGQIDTHGKIKLTITEINLTPTWADYSLSVSPASVEIWQGQSRLKTSNKNATSTANESHLTFKLPQGLHQLLIKKAGYDDYALALDAKPRTEVDLGKIQLNVITQKIKITSVPEGAIVTVNGQYQGLTPLFISKPHISKPHVSKPNVSKLNTDKTNSTKFTSRLSPDHLSSLSIKVQKQGYQEISKTVPIEQTTHQPLLFTLTPLLGEIIISANIDGASIYINNQKKGVTKKSGNTFMLPSNTQTIKLVKSGYQTTSKTIRPINGKSQRFRFSLLTEQEYQWARIPKTYQTQLGKIPMKLFRPDATFKMGSSRREQGRKPNEYERKVSLSKAFYLGQMEISNQQFKLFKPQHTSGNIGGRSLNLENHPAANLDWLAAAQFCNWLSKQESLPPFYRFEEDKLVGITNSHGYRLPTEAEWAWVARYQQGKMARFTWGNSYPPQSSEAGNIADSSLSELLPEALRNYRDGYPYSAPVGSFAQNAHNIFDLGGNVAEWIHDFYTVKTGILAATEVNPLGPESGDFHVIRGPSWKSGGLSRLRLSHRDSGRDARNDLGFRVARFAKPQPNTSSLTKTTQTSQ